MALLRRSLKYVAVTIGVLLGLLAVATASFFDRYLKGETESLLRAASPRYPEVRFEARQGSR